MSGVGHGAAPRDAWDRPLASLRLSVTDRCNLRCSYCMPEESYTWLARSDLLTFEEAVRLVGVFAGLGVRRVRLTGGEPLLRSDLHRLVRMLAAAPGVDDLALTTNAVLLGAQAAALHEAGLHRVTVSLDTLRPERFRQLTGRTDHDKVLAGLQAAAATGFPLKINVVVVRGFNDDELADLIALGRRVPAEVRFIEYMDVGGATRWSADKVVPRSEMLERIERREGPASAVPGKGSAPAERFALPDGTTFGVIASTTAPFCGSCDRSRLTADGMWYRCLYATDGFNLRALLRGGASDAEIASELGRAWEGRTDRGAESRLGMIDRQPLLDARTLRTHPHREMHTRGG